MNFRKMFFTPVAIIERIVRLFGRVDLFTNLDDSGLGFFAFERVIHPGGDREYWGLGLHIIATPIRVRPRSA